MAVILKDTHDVCLKHIDDTTEYLGKLGLAEEGVESDPQSCAPSMRPDTRSDIDKQVSDIDKQVSDIDEMQGCLDGFIPANNDEWFTLVTILHDAIDSQETVESDYSKVCEPYRKPLSDLLDTHRPLRGKAKAFIDAVKSHLLAIREAMEQAQIDAAESGLEVPPLFDDPPGLSWPEPELVIEAVDESALDDRFFKLVPDLELIKEALAADEEVPGVTVEYVRKVSFRRPAK
jgi:hypothetical protein